MLMYFSYVASWFPQFLSLLRSQNRNFLLAQLDLEWPFWPLLMLSQCLSQSAWLKGSQTCGSQLLVGRLLLSRLFLGILPLDQHTAASSFRMPLGSPLPTGWSAQLLQHTSRVPTTRECQGVSAVVVISVGNLSCLSRSAIIDQLFPGASTDVLPFVGGSALFVLQVQTGHAAYRDIGAFCLPVRPCSQCAQPASLAPGRAATCCSPGPRRTYSQRGCSGDSRGISRTGHSSPLSRTIESAKLLSQMQIQILG